MSATTVYHCDYCGETMRQDFAKLMMPAELKVSERLVKTPKMPHGLELPPTVMFTSNGEPPVALVTRVYDVCEKCAHELVAHFVGVGVEVKARMQQRRRDENQQRLQELWPLDARD